MELILSPIKFLYLLAYTVCCDITKSYALALPLLSVMTVTIIYFCHHRAAKLENDEKLIRSILEPQIAEIKDKYHGGADRQAAIERLYHRYAYSPLYAVREAAGVLLQLPFLFGAYAMISTFPLLGGVSFGLIADLSQPDGLLGGFNLLPFVMTGANIATVFLATPAGSRERKQGVVSALVFLVLLYVAPSALLVYWTGNNLLYLAQEIWKRGHVTAKTAKFQAAAAKLWKKCSTHFFLESFALVFTAGLYAPIQLYLTNAKDLWFSLYDILPLCFECSLAAFILFALFDRFVRGQRRIYYLAFLAALALMIYLQGSYLNADYGELDGHAIDWAAYRGTAIINTTVWALGILVPLILAWKKPLLTQKCAKFVAAGLVFVQLLTLAVLTEEWQPPKTRMGRFFSNDGLYTLGKKENIVIFILDNYDVVFFDEFIKSHPEYKESVLKDFTFYPDTVGGSAPTFLAMPHILTGQPFTTNGDFDEYVDLAFHEAKLYPVLKKHGFDTRIYTLKVVPLDFADYIANIRCEENKVGSYWILAKNIYKFVRFTYYPHLLKRHAWLMTKDFDAATTASAGDFCFQSDDSKFYNNLLKENITLPVDKAFRLYHLEGAHPPFILNRDARSKKMLSLSKKSTQSLMEQEEGVMTILGEFFAQMKRLGIYESSTIILLADHGDTKFTHCNPLFLIKRGTAAKEFTVDNTPISFKRLQPTLLNLLGESVEGLTVFDKTPEKERIFYRQRRDKFIEEISIEGKLPYDAKITRTGRLFKGVRVEN